MVRLQVRFMIFKLCGELEACSLYTTKNIFSGKILQGYYVYMFNSDVSIVILRVFSRTPELIPNLAFLSLFTIIVLNSIGNGCPSSGQVPMTFEVVLITDDQLVASGLVKRSIDKLPESSYQ